MNKTLILAALAVFCVLASAHSEVPQKFRPSFLRTGAHHIKPVQDNNLAYTYTITKSSDGKTSTQIDYSKQFANGGNVNAGAKLGSEGEFAGNVASNGNIGKNGKFDVKANIDTAPGANTNWGFNGNFKFNF